MSVRDSLTRTLPPWGLRAIACLVAMLVVSVLVPPPMAYATALTGPPDANGNYAVCNFTVASGADFVVQSTTHGRHQAVNVRCNYGKDSGESIEALNITEQYSDGSTTATTYPSSFWPDTTAAATCSQNFSNTDTGTMPQRIDIGENTSNQTAWVGVCRPKTGNTTGSPSINGFTGCQVRYLDFGLQNCRIGTVTVGDSSTLRDPLFSPDFYPGGVAGPTRDAVKGTGWPCTRTLDNTSTMVGSFNTSPVTQNEANAAPTQAVWNWGDSSSNTTISTAGPTYQANHTFPAIGSMPTNGWTTSVTVTYTATSGHLFSDGSSTNTSVCSLRVDFLHPDQSSPGSSDNGSTGDAGLDACIPSGWGILNPINLIGGVGCMLKKLFIPTSTTSDAMTSMWTGITSKAPFSVLYEVVTFIPQNLDDFVYAVNAYSPVVSHPLGGPNTSPICASDNANTTHTQLGLCDYSGAYPFEGGGPFRVDGGTGHVTDPNVYLVRQIALFALGLLFFYACYRGVGEILK